MIKSIKHTGFILFGLLFYFGIGKSYSQTNESDSIASDTGHFVQKAIYSEDYKKHRGLYNKMWGTHYRDLYYMPVTVRTESLDSLNGELTLVEQFPQLQALIFNDRNLQPYLVKPISGSSGFLESGFFRYVYKKEDYKDTYIGDFIKEAYTIVHPYMFLVTEDLADKVGLTSADSRIRFITGCSAADTIADGSSLKDRVASVSRLPGFKDVGTIDSISVLLDSLKHKNNITIDQRKYIKSRMFDMLTGDWNKIPENWYWVPAHQGDSIVYSPYVFDRNHAFTKVDGSFFKELLNMLGLDFITDYKGTLKNVKKFNGLAYAADIALTQKSGEKIWMEEAESLQNTVTDKMIDDAFSKLPKELRNKESESIKKNLKIRRGQLKNMAARYYHVLQKTPVITGTDQNDKFTIDQVNSNEIRIRIYDGETDRLTFDKNYNKKSTKEIWIYGLNGNDSFEVNKPQKNIPVLLIGGKGKNDYKVDQGKNIFIYESKSEKERLDSLKHGKVIIPNKEDATEYDYTRLRYTKFAFTPIGIYDSDLGLNLGTSFSYTIYGFRRAPYTRKHQLSYDYTHGFTYQGIFPSYDKNKSFHLAAYLGSPAYFSNFFGFGNETDGYKDESKNYNRVNIRKYMLTPSFFYDITKEQTISLFGSFESYKVKDPEDKDRFINTVYSSGSSIYSTKYYFDLGLTYEYKKEEDRFVSSIDASVTSGYNFNIADPELNYFHANADFGINLKLTDRLTFATMLKGKILFSDKYEFFQAATTELRGFRDNRFIGKQSFYEYSDIRFNMGRLKNPLTPLDYGIFAGIDHGRVWYQGESSDKWHSSYGGGFWLTVLRRFTGKFSYFGSSDGSRFSFELGMGF